MKNFKKPIIKKELLESFKVKISQTAPLDVAFSEMVLSDYELLVKTIYRLNELIKINQEYIDLTVDVLEWVIGDGLTIAVLDKLSEWKDDGTLDQLINDLLFQSKLDKTEFEDFKTQLNLTIDNLTDNFNDSLDQLDNKLNGDMNQLDNKLTGDMNQLDNKLTGDMNQLDNKLTGDMNQLEQNLNDRGVSVKDYGAVGDGVNDDTLAIQTALDENMFVILPQGDYRVTNGLKLRNGNALVGVAPNIRKIGSKSNSTIIYDGDPKVLDALILMGENEVGQPFSIDASNIYLKNLVLKGGNKMGFGVYSTYITNESTVENVTAEYFTEYGMYFAKSWYSKIHRVTCRYNDNIGISFGEPIYLSNGSTIKVDESHEMNGCFISEIRSHWNGQTFTKNGTFNQNKIPLGSGIVIGHGNGFFLSDFLSETNGGVNMYLNISGGTLYKIEKGYLENTNYQSPLNKDTERIGLYMRFGSSNIGIIEFKDIYSSLYTGGGFVIEDNQHSKFVKWVNIQQPAFLTATQNQRSRMLFKNVYNTFANTNIREVYQTPIAIKSFNGSTTENMLVSTRYGTWTIFVKKLGNTNPSSLTITLNDGTITSRSISSLPNNISTELAVINNIEKIAVTNPVSNSDGFIVEVVKNEPIQ